ncbi:MAG TPA: hypothetical protein VGJ81_12460 [Thermoanaerobaculia bacterium]
MSAFLAHAEPPAAHCPICRFPEHRRFYNYKTLGELLDSTPYGTIKTWASLTNAWIERAHPNAEIAWKQLMRAVNTLPTGAPMILRVTSGQQKARAFRPLPPPIAPQRYSGCVCAAWVYREVLIGPEFFRMDLEAATNSRKERAAALRGPDNDGGRRNG